jgi:tRNA A37 threonylcarbamoyltransferase TsaD
VCPRITQLVQEQVDTLNKSSLKAKAVFLVGGFGANKYLKEELQKSFQGIEIQQPKDA